MPAVKATYSGLATIVEADGLTPTPTAIGASGAVTLNNSLLSISFRTNYESNVTERVSLKAELYDDAGQIKIRWTRANANNFAPTIYVEYSVTEFESSALAQPIQRGVIDCTSATQTITLGSTVSETESIYITNLSTSLRVSLSDDKVGYLAQLIGGTAAARTSLELTFNSAPASGNAFVAWQVATFNSSDIVVKQGTTTFTTSGTASISGFATLADMFVLKTGQKRGNPSSHRAYTRVHLDSLTQLSFNNQAYGTGSPCDVSWLAVELLDNVSINRGTVDITSTNQTPAVQPAFTVDYSKSSVLQGHSMSNAYCTSTTADVTADTIFSGLSLNTDGSGLTITRGGTASTTGPVNFEYVAIEWAVAGGGVTLTVSDLAHSHSLDNLALTQANVLAVNALDHTHALDNIDLTQANVLALSELLHGHALDNIDLTQAVILSVSELGHSHALDSIDLTQANTLSVAELLHTHALDNVILSTAINLLIANLIHAHALDNVSLTQANTLSIAELLHGNLIDNVDLTQANILSVQELTHSNLIDNVVLNTSTNLTVSDLLHGHALDAMALTQAHALTVQELLHSDLLDGNINLGTQITLSVGSLTHAHTLENISWMVIITPSGRTYIVDEKNRVYLVEAKNRTYLVN